MSHSLPHGCDRTQLHDVPEEARQDDRQLGKIIAVDVDAGEGSNDGSGAHPQAPVPLPSTANGPEALFDGEVELSMFVEVHEDGDDSKTERTGETQPNTGANTNMVDRMPTPCDVEPGAIVEENRRGIGRKGQETPGDIRECLVFEKVVVPSLENRLVEVNAADNRVGGTVASREGDRIKNPIQRVARIENGRHGSGAQSRLGRLESTLTVERQPSASAMQFAIGKWLN